MPKARSGLSKHAHGRVVVLTWPSRCRPMKRVSLQKSAQHRRDILTKQKEAQLAASQSRHELIYEDDENVFMNDANASDYVMTEDLDEDDWEEVARSYVHIFVRMYDTRNWVAGRFVGSIHAREGIECIE